MQKYGRYSQMHPNSNLRIIALNNIVNDIVNTFLWINEQDPTNELKWLEEVLEEAERNKEQVLIIGHLPPGCYIGEKGN